MKIYWVVVKCEDDEAHRCFFRESKAEAESDVIFRRESQKEDNKLFNLGDNSEWWVEEDEVSDDQFCYCRNSDKPYHKVLPYSPQCSLGVIHALRNDWEGDDGTCGTCSNMIKNPE